MSPCRWSPSHENENVSKLILTGIFVDIFCLILVFIPYAVLELIHKPYQRGFFCNDQSISHPYKEDTITILTVGLVGIIVPIAIILLTELLHHVCRDRSVNHLTHYRVTSSCSISILVVAWYQLIGFFLFGLAISQAITDIGKFTIGRLRPHFLDVCRPDLARINCTSPTSTNEIFLFVQDAYCQGTDEGKLVQARMSFPSGHSSMSAYCAMFVVLYVHARLTWRGSRLLRHLLQALCIYTAFYVCLSRVSDYKHHWSDVLCGAIIGVFCATVTCMHVARMFRNERSMSGQSKALSVTTVNDDLRGGPATFVMMSAAPSSGYNSTSRPSQNAI